MAVAVEGFPPPRMPSRVMVRSYREFPGATGALERLRSNAIPPERVTIVARGLAWAEDVAPARAARLGAVTGAGLGTLAAFVLLALGFAGGAALLTFLAGVAAGAAAGFAAHRFLSEPHVDVAHYDVLVDEEVAAEARTLLAHERVEVSS